MRKTVISYLFLFFMFKTSAAPLEVDVTEGKIEPLPVAITKFYSLSSKGEQLSDNIFKVVVNNLNNSGLFKAIPNEAFLQSSKEVYLQPLFSDWKIIDANLILSGKISLKDNVIEIEFKLWDVYKEKLLVSKKIANVPLNNWRITSHIISNIIYESVTNEKGYFDTKIVYIHEKIEKNRKKKRIAVMDYDGENHTFLTAGKNLVLTPRFAPNGKEIVYLSYQNNKPSVYRINLKTGRKQVIGNFQGMSFAPRFSPDGTSIIFSLTEKGGSNIFLINLNSREKNKLTFNKYINTSPSFSPDGKQIVFSSDRAGKQNLYVKDIKNKNNPLRISYGKGNYATPVWSPRGDYIAFTKSYKGSFFIGLIKSNGKDERIVAKGYLTDSPTWSPNGRTLAYYKVIKNKDGKLESKLFSIDVTGNLEKEIITPGNASDPNWGPSLTFKKSK